MLGKMMEDDEMVACVICGSRFSTDLNPILYCDGKGCNVPVHKDCYGVDTIPDGDWFCERCGDGTPVAMTKALCCERKDGAFYKTLKKREYAHMVCAHWNPSIRPTIESGRPYDIPQWLMNRKTCCICGRLTGLTVSCSVPGCNRYFHVTCAILENHLDLQPLELVTKAKLACPRHSQQVRDAQRFMLESSSSSDSGLDSADSVLEISDDDDDHDSQDREARTLSSKVDRLAQKTKASFQSAMNNSNQKFSLSARSMHSNKSALADQTLKKLAPQFPLNSGNLNSTNDSSMKPPNPFPKTSSFDRFNPAKGFETYTSASVSFESKKRSIDAVEPLNALAEPSNLSQSSIESEHSLKSTSSNLVKRMKNCDISVWIASKMNAIKELASEVGKLSPDMTDGLSIPVTTSIRTNNPENTLKLQELQQQVISVQSQLLQSKKENSRLRDAKQLAQQQLQELRVNVVKLFGSLNLPNCPIIEKPSEVDNVVEQLCKILGA